MTKLTPAAHIRIDDLCNSAKYWGWQEDQGVGPSVKRAEDQYKKDREALETYVAGLNDRIRKLLEKKQ